MTDTNHQLLKECLGEKIEGNIRLVRLLASANDANTHLVAKLCSQVAKLLFEDASGEFINAYSDVLLQEYVKKYTTC